MGMQGTHSRSVSPRLSHAHVHLSWGFLPYRPRNRDLWGNSCNRDESKCAARGLSRSLYRRIWASTATSASLCGQPERSCTLEQRFGNHRSALPNQRGLRVSVAHLSSSGCICGFSTGHFLGGRGMLPPPSRFTRYRFKTLRPPSLKLGTRCGPSRTGCASEFRLTADYVCPISDDLPS